MLPHSNLELVEVNAMRIKPENQIPIEKRVFMDVLKVKDYSIRKLVGEIDKEMKKRNNSNIINKYNTYGISEKTVRLSLERGWMYKNKLEQISKILDVDLTFFSGKKTEDLYKYDAAIERQCVTKPYIATSIRNEYSKFQKEYLKELLQRNTYEHYLQRESLAIIGSNSQLDKFTEMLLHRYGVNVQDYLKLDEMTSMKLTQDMRHAIGKIFKQYFPNLSVASFQPSMSIADVPAYIAGWCTSSYEDFKEDNIRAALIKREYIALDPNSLIRKLLNTISDQDMIEMDYEIEQESQKVPDTTAGASLSINNEIVKRYLKKYELL